MVPGLFILLLLGLVTALPLAEEGYRETFC